MFEDDLRKTQQALIRSGAHYLDPGSALPGALDFADFPTPYYPAEAHQQHVEVIVPISGIAAVQINDNWHAADSPKPLILLRGTTHTEHYFKRNQPYTLFWLVIASDGLNLHQTMYSPETGYGQSSIRLHTSSPFAAELWRASQSDDVDIPEFHALLLESIDHPLKHGGFDTSNYHRDVVLQTKNFIDRYYFRAISLEDLAALAHYTAPHLNRLFQRTFQCSIYAYLLDVRLRNAIRMLKDESLLIKDVASSSGFSDQRYFSRVFQQRFGVSPGEYRKLFLSGQPPA